MLLLAGVLAGCAASGSAQPSAAELDVHVMNLRSDHGLVGCTLFDSAKGFPTDPNAALQRRWCPITDRTASCRFDPIAAGTYAVACFHDENANGKLDTKIFGIPKEGTVVSNRAHGHMGPPKFQDARFRFDARPSTLALPIEYR